MLPAMMTAIYRAQSRHRSACAGPDAVQLRAQEIDEAAKIGIVLQRDLLGVYEIGRQQLRTARRSRGESASDWNIMARPRCAR